MWTLLLWTVVAYGGGGQFASDSYDWRPMVTNLNSEAACHKAVKKLERPSPIKQPLIFRCIGPDGQ